MADEMKTLKTRIALKYDTVENWENSTLKLLPGELAIDNLNRIKIGNADRLTWSELDFVVGGPDKAAIQLLDELPDPSAQDFDFEVGSLVVVDSKLYCLGEEVSDQTSTKKWVDLANTDEIATLTQDVEAAKTDISGIQSSLLSLNARDEAHDAALLALRTAIDEALASANGGNDALSAELATVKTRVAANETAIASNRADIEGVLDIARDEQTGEVTKRTVKLSAIPEAIYVDGKINSNALPSFVDDVKEGLIAVNNDPNDLTYQLTHDEVNSSKIIGFFSVAFGAGDGDVEHNEKTLKLIRATAPSEAELSTIKPVIDGITYKFAPVSEWEAPSSSTIYVDVMTSKSYRWSGSQFVVIAGDLALGETASSAFAGNRGVALENEINDTVDSTTGETVLGLKSRVENLETGLSDETAARESSLSILGSNLQSLESNLEDFKLEAAEKHDAIEQEIASSIIALKEEDSALETSILALQTQIDGVSATTSQTTFQDIVNNSSTTLNDDPIIIDCGGAGA